jgi:S1-C subfamily serine protease
VIRRAYLGISYEDLTPEIAARLRTQVGEGLVVGAVGAGSPAAAAGLQRGDIITRIDSQEIDNGGDFRRHMRQRLPGETATIVADRQGREVRLEARLGEVLAR